MDGSAKTTGAVIALVARVILGLFLLQAGAAVHAKSAYEEHQVKAVFLFHFASFVDWPAAAFSGREEPFRFCVLGESPVGETLRGLVAGEATHGRRIEFLSIEEEESVDACQILYLPAGKRAVAARTARRLQGRSILTVSDGDDFVTDGGMIGLVTERNRVRPHINVDALARGNLLASSKLLQLATIIEDHPRQARK